MPPKAQSIKKRKNESDFRKFFFLNFVLQWIPLRI
jgi:hypothetical protein